MGLFCLRYNGGQSRHQVHPQQQVFDVPEAQSEALVQPKGMTDGLGLEAVTTIT